MIEEPDDLIRFAFRRLPNGMRVVKLTYRLVSVVYSWPDSEQGHGDLVKFIEAMKEVMTTALTEMDIRDQINDLDVELDRFLTEGEKE